MVFNRFQWLLVGFANFLAGLWWLCFALLRCSWIFLILFLCSGDVWCVQWTPKAQRRVHLFPFAFVGVGWIVDVVRWTYDQGRLEEITNTSVRLFVIETVGFGMLWAPNRTFSATWNLWKHMETMNSAAFHKQWHQAQPLIVSSIATWIFGACDTCNHHIDQPNQVIIGCFLSHRL